MIRLRKTPEGYEVAISLTKVIPRNMEQRGEYYTKEPDAPEKPLEEYPPDTKPFADEIAAQLNILASNAPYFDEVNMKNNRRMTSVNFSPEEKNET